MPHFSVRGGWAGLGHRSISFICRRQRLRRTAGGGVLMHSIVYEAAPFFSVIKFGGAEMGKVLDWIKPIIHP